MFKNGKIDTRKICILAMLTAITVVLAVVGTFRIGNAVKIPLKFISVFITGAVFGPVAGGITSAMGDVINAFAFPVGQWLPQLTIVEFMSGFLFGTFFHNKDFKGKGYLIRTFFCVASLFVLDMIITTHTLAKVGYFPGFEAGFMVRLPAGVTESVMQTAVILAMTKFLPILQKEVEKGNKFRTYANSFQAVTRPGLERINALLEEMGNPHKKVKCVHIAGTNGKGSVAAFMQKMLMAQGYKTGKYISPNLVKVNERITVNDVEISNKELNKLLKELEKHSKAVEKKLGEIPTQFEVWTAAAFKFFADCGCNFVVLETGLGGRLDATNVIGENALTVITKIDFDHMNYLGDTLEKIAGEKAGIIKPGSAVVSAPQYPEVEKVLREKAVEKGCEIFFAETPDEVGFEGIYEIFKCGEITVKLGLGGTNQLENAAVAVLGAKKLGIDEKNIIKGLETAENPARFEMVGDRMIFDGGHNPSGVKTLVKNLEKYYPNEEKLFVMASMKDKDITENLKLIGSLTKEIRFVRVLDNERSAKAEELAEKARNLGLHGVACGSLAQALANTEGKLVVICGSLYLYKDFKEM